MNTDAFEQNVLLVESFEKARPYFNSTNLTKTLIQKAASEFNKILTTTIPSERQDDKNVELDFKSDDTTIPSESQDDKNVELDFKSESTDDTTISSESQYDKNVKLIQVMSVIILQTFEFIQGCFEDGLELESLPKVDKLVDTLSYVVELNNVVSKDHSVKFDKIKAVYREFLIQCKDNQEMKQNLLQSFDAAKAAGGLDFLPIPLEVNMQVLNDFFATLA